MKKFLFILMFALLINTLLYGYDGPFYVSKTGNDSNDGSIAAPFLTIQHGVDVVATNVLIPTCYIAPGLYNEAIVIANNNNLGYMILTSLSNNNPAILSTSSSYGVKIECNNIEINNLIIKKYTDSGIYIKYNAHNAKILNNLIYSNSTYGIHVDDLMDDTDNHYIAHNIIWGDTQDYGIYIKHGHYCSIYSNQLFKNHNYELLMENSTLNIIRGNTIYSNAINAYSGFRLYNSSEISVIDNDIWGNSGYGLFSTDASYNSIYSNSIANNGNSGIIFTANSISNKISYNNICSNSYGLQFSSANTKNNEISYNKFWGANQLYGLYLEDGSQNNIYYNVFFNNQNGGILLNAVDNDIINNTFYNNPYGIYSTNISSSRVVNNIFLSNTTTGIFLSSSSALAKYNAFYGNATDTSGGVTMGLGNLFTDPMLITSDNSLEISSGSSSAVDSGTNILGISYFGSGADMGWKEYVVLPPNHGPFYVSKTGNDSNDGSIGAPFLTIQHGVDVMATNVTVATTYVFPGVYLEDVLINNNNNSGYMVITGLSNNNLPILDGEGSKSYGFNIHDADKIIVQKFKVKNFTVHGIYLDGTADENIIQKNVMYSNTWSGIMPYSTTAQDNSIISNEVYSSEYGIAFNGSDYNIIKFNILHNNNYGTYVTTGAQHNTFSQNSVYSNAIAGIWIYGDTADFNTVKSNDTWGANQPHGIGIYQGDYNIIEHNNSHNNSQDGIYLSGSAQNNDIFQNLVTDNDLRGIYLNNDLNRYNSIYSNTITGSIQDSGINLFHSGFNDIYDNKIIKNQICGILMTGNATSNKIRNNIFASNLQDGLRVAGSDNNNIYRNVFFNNQTRGIYFSSDTTNDIKNNTFYNNPTGIYFASANDFSLIQNNIILSNTTGISSSGTAVVEYNTFYGNTTDTNGVTMGTGNVFTDPILVTEDDSFEINSADSSAVDSGTIIPGITDGYIGNAPDMGWKESSYVPEAIPTLYNPTNALIMTNSSPEYIWENIKYKGVNKYHIEVRTNNINGAVVANDNNVTSTNISLGSLNEGTYLWRVCAYNTNTTQWDSWSSSNSFTIDTSSPTQPSSVNPANGILLTNTAQTLIWTKSSDSVSGVSGYSLTLVTNNITNTFVLSGANNTNQSVTLSENINYWAVSAFDNAGNISAKTFWTITIDTTPPNTPTYVSPLADIFTNNNTIFFKWNSVTDVNGIAYYQFATNGTVVTNVTTTNYLMSGLPEGTNLWAIRAVDNAGHFGSYSTPTRILIIDTLKPSAPNLLSPTNGLLLANTTPTLIWHPSSDGGVGVTNYILTLNGSTTNIVSTNFISTNLQQGTNTWQVSAVDKLGNTSSNSSLWKFVVDTVAPPVVTLNSPSSNITLSSNNTAFTWNSVVDATTLLSNYIVEIDNDSGFGSVDYTKITNGTSLSVTGMNNGAAYYWRVRAYDIVGNTNAWSSVWSVSIDTNQIAPTLWSPTDGSISSDTTPTFVWSQESGISSNQIVIDNTTNTYDSATTNYMQGSALSEGSHTWMVRVYKTATGTWQVFSGANTCIVDLTSPSVVSLESPANGNVTTDTTPTLSWLSSTDTNGISDYSIVIDGTTNSTSGNTNYTSGVLTDGSHTWQVIAIDPAGNSSVSASRTVVVDITGPNVVSLNSPASNSPVGSSSLTFMWNGTVDSHSSVSNYILEYDDDSFFGSSVTIVTDGTSVDVSGLLNSTTYYWHVKAYDILGNTNAWSSKWSVAIDTNNIVPTLHSPTNNTISRVTTPTFVWSQESGISSNQIVIDNTTNTYDSATTNYTQGSALSEGSHTWMVRVYKISTDTWQIFTLGNTFIIDSTGPVATTNMTPVNGSTIENKQPVLTWAIITDAVSNEIEIDGSIHILGNVTSYTLSSELSAGVHTWKIRGIDSLGNAGTWAISTFIIQGTLSTDLTLNSFKVSPNPLLKSQEQMAIDYYSDGPVQIQIFTIMGNLVNTLDGDEGINTIYWYGKNDGEKEVASGIYLMLMRMNGKKVFGPIKVGYIKK